MTAKDLLRTRQQMRFDTWRRRKTHIVVHRGTRVHLVPMDRATHAQRVQAWRAGHGLPIDHGDLYALMIHETEHRECRGHVTWAIGALNPRPLSHGMRMLMFGGN